MLYLNGENSNYDKFPDVKINGYDNEIFHGYNSILDIVKEKLKTENKVVVLDCYTTVDEAEVLSAFKKGLSPELVINSKDIFYDKKTYEKMIARYLTEDRVFGICYYGKLDDFISKEKLRRAKELIDQAKGTVLIYGVGASLIHHGDLLIYADMTCWEAQMRYRRGGSNFLADNPDEDNLRKFKRGYFLDWRICDRHKKDVFKKMDFILDTTVKDDPKMLTSLAFFGGLKQMVSQPFRTVPFFDPAVWGGQWMKEVFDIEEASQPNYGWSYTCLMNENGLLMNYNGILFAIPANDLVYTYPIQLIGEKGFSRFGMEYPIRFDFLDTMGGGNLSLQVHPDTQFAKENFGLTYTQDESYYILDAGDDGITYLGIRTGADKEEMMRELYKADQGELEFDADKYTNCFPAKKHDHFLIPAGIVHCAGGNTMVLEISSSPCIFTFKLWDWGRRGLDGLPRPTHVSYGERVIQWDKRTKWIEETCVNQVKVISNEEGVRIEKTGLHENEFIETHRHTFSKKVRHKTGNETNVLNLIEGKEAIVESVDDSFKPFVVHFAETFVIPAVISEYTIAPHGESVGKEIMTIKAFVRF